MSPLAQTVMSVGRRRGAAYRGRDAPGGLLRRRGSLCARSGGTAILFQRPESTKTGPAVEGEAASAPKIGSVARGPSAPRPGAATPPGRAPKMLLGAKCSEKGPPRRLPSCAERRAGTAPAALSYPPPPPRRASQPPAAPCTSSTPILSLLLPAPSARDSTHLGAAPILPLPPSASPWSSPLAPR